MLNHHAVLRSRRLLQSIAILTRGSHVEDLLCEACRCHACAEAFCLAYGKWFVSTVISS